MNKFFTSALFSLFLICLISTNTFGQVMLILNNNGDTLNGKEVVVDGVYTSTNMVYSATVLNNSNQTYVVNCRRRIVEKVNGTGNYFCWGTQCYGEPVNVGNAPDTIPSGQVNETFHGYFKPYNIGGVNRIRYVFYDVNTPADSVFFTVKFNCTLNTSGIADLQNQSFAAELYPTIASEEINIRSGVPAFSVALYDLNGRMLAAEGTSMNGYLCLNVSALPVGFYQAVLIDKMNNRRMLKKFIKQ